MACRLVSEEEYREFDDIQPGDVFLLRGLPRMARAVRRTDEDDAVRWVYVAIRRPSWTGRCWTLFNRADLVQGWGGYVARGLPLATTDLERRVQMEIEAAFSARSYQDMTRYVPASRMAGAVV